VEAGNSAVTVVAASGATRALAATAGMFDVTMSQNCTFTFDNPPVAGRSFALVLRGAFIPTFPASVKWSGGAPGYVAPALYTFTTVDTGATWFGSQVGKAFA
jgi:hypothetical protein